MTLNVGIMLGVQTKKQPIVGKYAKRLTETISRGKSDSKTQSAINPTNHTGSSDRKYEVVWE